MAPQYKLLYFNARGRAENIRMLFANAGVKYEDARFEPKDWPKHKPNTPFGQVPVLEIDGEQFAQSNAILRYLAREFGVDGGSSRNIFQVDMLIESVTDVWKDLYEWMFEADATKKAESLKKFTETTLPKYFSKFDSIIAKNGHGWSVGSSLTVADIALSNVVATSKDLFETHDFKKYPALLALQKKVHELPKIKEWISKRPETNA